MTITVTYARFSSNLQNEASIDDQQRICNEFAQSNDLTIKHEYTDHARSGDDAFRPGFQKLMTAVKERTIDIILVDDLSRLSRGANHAQLHEQFNYNNVRLISVSDGIDSSSDASKIQIGFKGIMNNIFLDDLKKRVHRGQKGKMLKGFNAGGRRYGYDSKAVESATEKDIYGRPVIEHVIKVINEEHAIVIRGIFEKAADGVPYRTIATDLNYRNVPTLSGGTWTATTICGNNRNPHSGILNNPLYIGEYYWNRTKKIRNPDTGKKNTFTKSKDEWIMVLLPELRIVPDELWKKVKDRQSANRIKTKNKQANSHANARTGAAPKFLLSGILKCDECNGPMITLRPGKYGCSNAHRRGLSVCSNKYYIDRDTIDSNLLSSIKKDLFTEEAFNVFKKTVDKLIKERKKEFSPAINRINKELSDVDKRLDKLIDLLEIKDDLPDTVIDKIKLYEEKKIALTSQLQGQSELVKDIRPFLPRAMDRFRNLVDTLPQACRGGDMASLREKVSALLGGKVMLRRMDHSGWECTYKGAYSGLLRVGTSKSEISDETLYGYITYFTKSTTFKIR